MPCPALSRGVLPFRGVSRQCRARPHLARASSHRLIVTATSSDREEKPSYSSWSELPPKKHEKSARIQKDLAARLLAAQTGWVPSMRPRRDEVDETVERDASNTIRDTNPSESSSDSSISGLHFSGDTNDTVLEEATKRGQWLLGLLVLQSSSSVVLENYGELIRDHLEITLFLTMLVGAGGNAGNQSAIRVIRGLATGEFVVTNKCALHTAFRQLRVGLVLGAVLATGGFLRVILSRGVFSDVASDVAQVTENTNVGSTAPDPAVTAAIGISASLFAIVTTSTLCGSLLPFLLAKLGQDPANAGTTVQVVMDVLGVVITCAVCAFVFEFFAADGGFGVLAGMG